MLKSQRLNVIQKLAAKKENDSVISFGQCKSKLSAMENQLTKLYQYRDDYNSQFNITAAAGIKGSNIQDYLKFINNLNHNIDSLLQAISKQKNICEKLKLDWMEKHKQVKIFSNVKKKYLETELTEKLKQEQILLDEYSTSFYLRRKS
ncbi:MAG: flagellar export protein FliJ [Pseudomonadota bacterium]